MQKYWLQSTSPASCSLSVSPPLPLTRRTRPDCLRPLKHLFQLALPSWTQGFKFSWCHLHITLNQKKKKKKQNLAVTVQAMAQRHFIKRRCDRRSTELCVCVKERDMRLVEKTTVSGIERQREREKLCISSVISHLPHREKSQYLINLLI